jgi:NADH-quinone oxidoreductase subunit I
MKTDQRPSLKNLAAMMKGLSITFRYLFKKPVTVSYPEVKRPNPARTKGRHWLRLWPDGMERCVGCLACMEVCPAQAILVVPADNPPDKPVSKAKKYSADFQINYLRCIFDGACEEVCPVDAIILSNEPDLAGYSREDFIFTKEKLNEPHPGASGIDVNWTRRPAPAPKPAAPKPAAAPAGAPAAPQPAPTPASPSAPAEPPPAPDEKSSN